MIHLTKIRETPAVEVVFERPGSWVLGFRVLLHSGPDVLQDPERFLPYSQHPTRPTRLHRVAIQIRAHAK